ncbi:MAG TPA: hemerythrin domain-containing protein [Ornithinibacter sp.]|nr:hemerythrin domain-containing protein [Ornithinibacter sp.]
MCGYCGCESIDVIGRFMREHVAVINATGDLRRACATTDLAAVHGAVAALGALLDPHTAAEEVGLFAVLAEDPEFADHVRRLCAEHVVLGELLGRVDRGEHDLFPLLERALREHIDREENGLFPAAAVAFAGPEWGRVTALTPDPGADPAPAAAAS